MNAAHLHLIFNHVPVVGLMFALAFFLIAILRGKDILIKAALWMILLVALSTIPAYLTGEPAHEYIDDMAGVSHDIIHEHEETAEVAFVSALVLGLLALLGLVIYRRKRHLSKMFLVFILLVAVVVAALMVSAANQGGEIRHPEIRPEPPPPETIESSPGSADTLQPSVDETETESENHDHDH